MKKNYLLFIFLFIASIALCAYPEGAINNIDGSVLGWDDENQVWRPVAVDSTGGLTAGGTSIESISVDTSAIESYLRVGDGQTATTTVTDLTNDIGTDTRIIKQNIIDIAKSSQPSEFRTTRLTISASTATQVNVITDAESTATNRVFVELRAIDPDDEFYIGFANTVTDSNGRPVKGRILLNMPSSQALYIYHTNASAIDIQQTEGWR